jgi:hypothetical protein
MADITSTLINFIVSLIVSTAIIYIVTRIFAQKEGFGTAFLTALVGAIVYTIAYYFLGTGFLAAIIGGIVWLGVLTHMYDIGFLRSLLIAVIIWIGASLVSFVLPTAPGPL